MATMNVNANDITLKNLTITNNYGFDFKERTILMLKLILSPVKKNYERWSPDGIKTMNMATRLKAVNCHFRSYAVIP
ncbi:MAG: hypothetical protein IPQ25_17850 [Chitinophagaceae bacterium]|nr:hypothetical protein [Chitinophagaceae bacterium]